MGVCGCLGGELGRGFGFCHSFRPIFEWNLQISDSFSVKKWFYKRQSEGRNMAYSTPEAFLEDWYQHKAVWYVKLRK